jgi:hypothetical protein
MIVWLEALNRWSSDHPLRMLRPYGVACLIFNVLEVRF